MISSMETENEISKTARFKKKKKTRGLKLKRKNNVRKDSRDARGCSFPTEPARNVETTLLQRNLHVKLVVWTL